MEKFLVKFCCIKQKEDCQMKNRKTFTGIMVNFMIVIIGFYIQIENMIFYTEDVNIFFLIILCIALILNSSALIIWYKEDRKEK